jgi:hypothetical protein
VSERKSLFADVLGERLVGPECPLCHRNDGSHNIACRVPEYISAWHRINREHAERLANVICESQASL